MGIPWEKWESRFPIPTADPALLLREGGYRKEGKGKKGREGREGRGLVCIVKFSLE